jgi:hypothetical protein
VSTGPRWTDVYQGLLTFLPTLPAFAGVPVYDGQPITNDQPVAWVTVGYVTDDGAGTFQQSRDPGGFATVEVGSVHCHLAAVDGGTELSVARSKAFALVAAWQSATEKDQTLGGALPPGSVVDLAVQVADPQNQQGSATSLVVTVSYQTLTYFNP